MAIVKGRVFVDGEFKNVDVAFENGKITQVAAGATGGVDVDVDGCYVIPGLVDLHFHGVMGCDLCDGKVESIDEIAKFQASVGTTSICPATMTYSEEILTPIMESVHEFVEAQAAGKKPSNYSRFVGINMEGPYISPSKVGAQNPKYVHAGDIDEFNRLQEKSGGMIKLVDVAPEEPGNLDFIKEAVDAGVRVSIAHTCADYDQACAAFDAGARQMTHLYNAMNPIHHRKPGPIVAGEEDNRVMAELISDGIHSHPAIIRLAFKLFGDDRIILISDTMRACGLDDGTYDLGGQDVTVKGSLATIADGSIAGSVTCLPDCLRYAVKTANIPLESAVKCATQNPARALGLDGKIGVIKEGAFADFVILDNDLNLKGVIIGGEQVK